MRIEVRGSALNHKLTHAGIVHAISNAAIADDLNDGTFVFYGDDGNGEALEILAALTEDDTLVVFHAMPLKYRNR